MKNLLLRAAVVSALTVAPALASAAPASAAPIPGGCVMVAGASCEFLSVTGLGTLTIAFTGGSQQVDVGSNDFTCPPIAAQIRADRAGVVVVPLALQSGCVYELSSNAAVTAVAQG